MGYREKSALARELLDEKEKWEKVLASGDPDRGPEAQLNIGILWHRNLGILLNQLGDRDGARAAYQAAIGSSDQELASDALLLLGNMLVREGDMAGAKAHWERALAAAEPESESESAFRAAKLLALVRACPQNPLYRTGRRSRLPHGLQLVQGGTGLGHDRLDQLRARRQVNDQPRHLS
jgi:tetratricopeptide (TPR) repeat protein